MPRPNKSGLDYFPLDVHVDEKIELVEAKHGIVGFGVVIKIFQHIYKNGYFLTVSEDRLLLLSKHVGVDNNAINDIINDCLKWELFNSDIYEKYSVLTSRGIQKRYIEATKRRKEIELIEQYLLIEDPELLYPEKVNVTIKSINVNINSKNANNKKQSKVKKRKETPYSPPKGVVGELKNFLLENIPENFNGARPKIIEFFEYRMQKPKAKRYQSAKGVNGLFRDLNNCQAAGYDLATCIDITMEKNWQTPSVDYFKPEMFQGATAQPQAPKKTNQQQIEDFLS